MGNEEDEEEKKPKRLFDQKFEKFDCCDGFEDELNEAPEIRDEQKIHQYLCHSRAQLEGVILKKMIKYMSKSMDEKKQLYFFMKLGIKRTLEVPETPGGFLHRDNAAAITENWRLGLFQEWKSLNLGESELTLKNKLIHTVDLSDMRADFDALAKIQCFSSAIEL